MMTLPDFIRNDGPEVTEDPADIVDEPARSGSARCVDGNGTLTHLLFSDEELDFARAKAICGECGLSESCPREALERVEPYGVWGGRLLDEGLSSP